MKRNFRMLILLAACFWMVAAPCAMAHSLWLNPGDYYPKIGSTVDIGIGWGHTYPASRIHQEVKEGRVESIQAVGPDGLPVPLTKVSAALYRLPIEKAGAYLITAKIKPGFFTMTPEGRKWGDRKSVADPIKCTNFHIEAKTALIAGGIDTRLGHAVGQPLEIIPLSNPRNLKSGDKLAVQVLFEGHPLAHASVRATYAGFESAAEAGHGATGKGHPSGKKHYPVETATDGKGQATLQLERAGYWMVMVSHKPAYPDPQVCDECMYNSDFTFEVGTKRRQALAVPPVKTQLYLVSVGNGDPDNITLRAVTTIKASDIVFCHERIQKKFPELLKGKEIHDPGFGIFRVYGKTRAQLKGNKRFNYDEKMKQFREISAIIRNAVKAGKTVSVLDSGDPTIFGPNMWYMEAFEELNPKIIPGVSCFNAANAALGKGVTSGEKTHSVILTASFGREHYDGPDSVEKLARNQATMAFFTMFMKLPEVVKQLETQYPADTPVAVVQHAGYREKERVIRGTLATILDAVKADPVDFEYMIYVGDFLTKRYKSGS
jgi:precorrin-4 methylase/uncharacterized GH25 family protein